MSRNIVLVTVDSLRADHCGYMGYDAASTPTLDRMAENGVAFRNAITPSPSTPESMTAVHTGDFVTTYEQVGGDGSVLASRRSNVRQNLENRPTIAETLSKAGYETAAFTPNTFASRHFGFSKGFDHFTDFLETSWSARIYQRVFEKFLEGNSWLTPLRLVIQRARNGEMFTSWEDIYDRILNRARSMDEPYFLWVFLLDVHLPYFVARSRRTNVSWLDMWRYNVRLYGSDPTFSEGEGEVLVDLYDATVERFDEFLSSITDDLTGDDPVFLVHADHGEAFGEHGTYGHEPYTYEENVHVPLVVSNLDRTADRDDPVTLRSLPLTIASVAGADEPFRAPSLFDGERSYVLTTPQGRPALRTRYWKYIRDGNGEELYHLREDPGEQNDLSDKSPDTLCILRGLLDSDLWSWREFGSVERSTAELAEEGTL